MQEGVETTVVCFRQSADEFEGIDPTKVLSYHPETAPRDYVAEVVSLSEAALNWMKTFNEGFEEVHFDTERRKVVVVNCGPPEIWLAAVFDAKRCELMRTETMKAMLHLAVKSLGSVNAPGGGDSVAEYGKAFQSLGDVAFRFVESKLGFPVNSSSGIHPVLDGLPILAAGATTFLLIRFLENSMLELTSTSEPSITSTMFLHSNLIVWSSSDPESTSLLYHMFLDTLNPGRGKKAGAASAPSQFAEEEVSSAFGLKLSFTLDSIYGSNASRNSSDGFVSFSPAGEHADRATDRSLDPVFTLREDEASRGELGGRNDGGTGVNERAAFVYVCGKASVVFCTDCAGPLSAQLRSRLGDVLSSCCRKIADSIEADLKGRGEKPPTSNADAACCDAINNTCQPVYPALDRPENASLRVELAAQLSKDTATLDGGDCFSDPTNELIVHSRNGIWASMQRSGLRRYYMLTDVEDTLIDAHSSIRKNTERIFSVGIP